MQRVVVDSDIVIDFTRKANPLFRTLIELSAQKKIKLFIPSVVVAELVAGQETKNQEKLKDLELLLGELLRDYQGLGLGDAIIAATCLSFDAKLATRNKKDFASIDGLRFFKR